LIIQDPFVVKNADTLFIESTYGNRNHKSFEESKKELLEAIHYSYHYKEKVIIPAFAVARTQELLYVLGEFFRNGLIPSMPVYLDSPLAIAATEIFRHMREYYDEDALEILKNGHDPLSFPELVLSRTAQDSMAINETSGPAIVIAGNGMCTAGRIKHHLKHNLWRQGCSIIIVGYQAAGTLGRRIVDGSKVLKVLGERIVVRARIFTIGGFSAHAGQSDLLDWVSHFENPLMRVYAIHGEESACQSFASSIRDRFGYKVHVPSIGDALFFKAEKPTEEAIREVDTLKWQQNLLHVVAKVDQLRRVMETSPESMAPELLQQLERELLRTEDRLDDVLRDASKATSRKSQQ
jgi:metallo-beta-lactamase family protein